MKINYKSDFELLYTLTDVEGNPMSVPSNAWELWLSVGNPLGGNVRKYVAKYDGGGYTNCEVRDDVIVVYADNHKLPCGKLWATFVDYQPNFDFADGDKRIYTPQPTDVELVSGAGDAPTAEDIRILANYVVYEHSYTAGQGITIEDDVISATGESYTAGAGIDISNGEIGLDTATQTAIASIAGKASEDELQNVLDVLTSDIAGVAQDVQSVEAELQEKADNTEIVRVIAIINNDENGLPSKADVLDVTALGNRVTAVEGDVAGLTTGNDPALRQSDATISGEIGKVVKVGLTGVGGVVSADIIEAKKIINGPVNSYALPDSDEEVKQIADDVIAMRSELAPIAEDVNTLTTNYNSIVNALNNQINELIEGKAMIAEALTDRGYPTQPSDSSASMAQKIENMAYDAGWLAQLDFTEQIDGGFKAEILRVKEIQDALRNGSLPNLRNRTDIYFINPGELPTTAMQYFLSGAANLRFVGEVKSNATDWSYFHYEGSTVLERIDRIDSPNATSFHRGLSNIKSIGYVDFSSAVVLTGVFWNGDNLIFIEIHNLGKAPACTSAQLNGSSVWGAGSEENRQSLVDSLLTYSYDRAAAGYSTCTITLHADTLARLTAEEIAAITAKGFTLTA